MSYYSLHILYYWHKSWRNTVPYTVTEKHIYWESYYGFYELFILWVYDKEAPLIPDIKKYFWQALTESLGGGNCNKVRKGEFIFEPYFGLSFGLTMVALLDKYRDY